jgi:small subunit ribosomal protein S10e
VPKKNRVAILKFLFTEGVMVCEKNQTMNPHPHVAVPNLHVYRLMQSLHSRGLVREQYAWRWLYYALTDKGITALREYLHAPADTVPNTLKKPETPVSDRPSFGGRFGGGGRGGRGGSRGGFRGRDGGRGDYRSKDGGAPRSFNPDFAGGRGGSRGGRGGSRGGRGGFRSSRGGASSAQ